MEGWPDIGVGAFVQRDGMGGDVRFITLERLEGVVSSLLSLYYINLTTTLEESVQRTRLARMSLRRS